MARSLTTESRGSGSRSRLAKVEKLHLTDVVHGAVITVSEGGTTAPSSSWCATEPPAPVLFLGHVVDPR
jgi:hypothetical protein